MYALDTYHFLRQMVPAVAVGIDVGTHLGLLHSELG